MEFERIRNIAAEVLDLDVEDIEATSSFAGDLGADSLEIFQIMCRIEEDFDMQLTYETMTELTTIQSVIDHIRSEAIQEALWQEKVLKH